MLFASVNDSQEIPEGAHANMPEVMAVGGTTYREQRVDYSNWGPHLSVTAPTGPGYPGSALKPLPAGQRRRSMP